MKRISLRTTLFLFIGLAILFAWLREPLLRFIRPNIVSWKLVENRQDFSEMLEKPNAFVFVHADWSMSSVAARREVEDFVVDWRTRNREPEMPFYFVDHTESTPKWLIEWGKSDNKLTCIHNGYGESIWLRNGEVLLRLHDYQNLQNDLREKTSELFKKNQIQ